MGATKIQVGYGTGQRGTKAKGLYGGRSTGKMTKNGGFNGNPTIDNHRVPDELWYKALPNSYRPSWDK